MSRRAPIDLDAVEGWLAANGHPSQITDVEPLAGGSQNIVLRLRLDDQSLVLRHPPPHPRPHSNRALVREMDVLHALASTSIPHPRLYAGCRDESVLGGAVFYLMQAVEGFNPGVQVPASYTTSPELVRAVGLEVGGVLADLGEVDPVAIGLPELGDPDTYLDRQIDNALTTWRGFAGREGHDPGWLPEVEETADWLRARRPAPTRHGIVHGDYHLSNIIVGETRPEVAAIVDWEMSTIGDPLVDLGWLLLAWPGQREAALLESGKYLVGLDGMISRSDLAEAYAKRSSRTLDQLDWYVVLAAFKFAMIVESTYFRSLEGKASRQLGTYVHGLARNLMLAASGTANGTYSVLTA